MNPQPPTIRKLRRDELGALLELYRHLHDKDDPISPERAGAVWEQILSNPYFHCFGADVEGKIVASCVLSITPNLTRGGKSYGIIENVVTHSTYRNRGIGSAMMRHALNVAWESGCYKVMLLTGRKSEAVQHFYESAGFVRGAKEGFVAWAPRQ